MKSGALIVTTKQDSYLRNGCFDPDSMIQFLADSTRAAKLKGFGALRVTGEMTWVLGRDPGSERLMEYEAKLNHFFPQHDCLAVCQYNRRRFSAEIIIDVIRTHPLVICGGRVCRNFYYVEPEAFLQPGRPEREVERLLANIQAREQSEQLLREGERRFADIADNALEWIWEVDAGGQYTYASPVVRKILGYEPEEIIGKHFYDLFHPEDEQRLREQASEVFDRRKPFREFINRNVHKNGTTIWLSTSGVPVFDEKGHLVGYRGADADITERRRTEEQLRQSQKLESIGRLAGGVAHDFGNLLTVIMGNVSALQRRRSLPAQVQESLKDMAQAANAGSALVRQLLAYAQGGLHDPGPTELNRIAESVVTLVQRTTPRDVTFSLKTTRELPTIMADATQIEQVMMNLCLNALEASEPPSTIEVITEEHTLSSDAAASLELPEGRYACLKVKDRGCGMDGESMDRMFDPFFTTKPTGRGMGLAATFGIVQRHHGQIRVDSTPGEGTMVSVWLPVSGADSSAASLPETVSRR
jgi:PAS domain S-box-containing protein